MATNLLCVTWTNVDPHELRLVLEDHFGHPGQYDGPAKNRLYLPLAGSSCRLALTFGDRRIVAIEPGPAFDGAEWQRISEEIEISVLAGPMKVGREYSFSSFRVTGSWRGDRSGVQILPPPNVRRARLSKSLSTHSSSTSQFGQATAGGSRITDGYGNTAS